MIQFYLYSDSSYDSAADADKSGALYALTSIDSFDEPSNQTILEDLMVGVQSSADCIGYEAPKLCFKVDDAGAPVEVPSIAKLFDA